MENNRGLFSTCLFRFKDRIKTKKEIFEIQNSGTVLRCYYFNYSIKKNTHPRLGILIKKFQKGTVDRNKTKRKIREIFRNNKGLFQYDTVIRVKKDIHKKSYKALKNEIQKDLINFSRGIKSE